MTPLLGPLRATPLGRTISTAAHHFREAKQWRGNAQDVAAYHESRPSLASEPPLSDRAWSDLELDSVFRRVDQCNSCIGQQVLYDLMRRPLSDVDSIRRRDLLIRTLSVRPQVVSDIGAALRPLTSPAAYDLHRLIMDDLPDRPVWFPVLPALSVTALLAFAVMFVHPLSGLLLLIATVACNMAVQIFYRPQVQHLIRPIGALPALLSAAERLAKLTGPPYDEYTGELAARSQRLRWVKRLSLHIRREGDANPLTSVLAGYTNLLFLADVNAFVFSIHLIRRHRSDIESLIEAIGTLDAMCGVAAFRSTLPFWCTPQLGGMPARLCGEGIYHPGVDSPVPNDLNVDPNSLLITGSNMAGKTTYLRAAGVCVVLGQSIATCPARSWSAPCLRVETLVNRKDDLQSGRSYFLTEAECVRGMLASAASTLPHIFIIDELYRGTNTHERISATRAVLEHLNGTNHICLVSTHDIELAGLLRGDWECWHFQESINDTGMHFDYRIRPGIAAAGNALKTLELCGYPASVMAAAYGTFDQIAGDA